LQVRNVGSSNCIIPYRSPHTRFNLRPHGRQLQKTPEEFRKQQRAVNPHAESFVRASVSSHY
jgi:hypothetical protein